MARILRSLHAVRKDAGRSPALQPAKICAKRRGAPRSCLCPYGRLCSTALPMETQPKGETLS
jgi:hypothetical protein